MCGLHCIKRTELCKAFYCWDSKLNRQVETSRGLDLDAYDIIYDLSRAIDTHSFTKLLSVTNQSKCSDPRDRIYALLGIAGEAKALQLKPDYTKPRD